MTDRKTYPLGPVQRDFLASLHRHGGSWYAGCGWCWETDSRTVRLLESLVRRGLVTYSCGNDGHTWTVVR